MKEDNTITYRGFNVLFKGLIFVALYQWIGIKDFVSYPTVWLLFGVENLWFIISFFLAAVMTVYAVGKYNREIEKLEDEEYELIDE